MPNTVETQMAIPPRIAKILDLARWAPSGDNTQPWRFEILDEAQFVVHAWDTGNWCVYDLDGFASQIAIGALLETIAIAARSFGLEARFGKVDRPADRRYRIEVTLDADETQPAAPLAAYIERRVTQRRPMSTRRLDADQRRELEDSVGESFKVVWKADPAEKRSIARLLFASAKIRLTIPEAYEVHKQVIDWGKAESADKIPDQAVGLDRATLRLMRWAMRSWGRVDFLNRYLAGTLAPRIQLDFLPGIRCGAHFLLQSTAPVDTVGDLVMGGRAMQRFWLESTRQGLQFQPEMTPLIFARYAANGKPFTMRNRAHEQAARLARRLQAEFGDDALAHGVFLGRVGFGQAPASRSVRLPLAELVSAPTPEG
jgi:hypothetical protein